MVYVAPVTVAIGYLRVSTDEQADSGAGLQAQRAAILAEAERRGWTEVQFIEDAGFGGGSLARPGLAAALEALRQHRADTLVVSKLDRLSRSLVDFAGLMARASREQWALVALDLGVDTTTPTGEMVANVMATFAQFERRLIGQRTKEALAEKRRAGVQLGRPTTLPDETAARIATAYRSGQTLRAIADTLTDEGVPTAQAGIRWYPSTVRAVLARVGEARRPRRLASDR
jgi:DNA invertase Pin-like site-specific DNA recombinase